MVMLYHTRLMPAGEVALWRGGKMVWQGAVGRIVDGVPFDTVSLNVDDGVRFSRLIGGKSITADVVLATIANWWDGG